MKMTMIETRRRKKEKKEGKECKDEHQLIPGEKKGEHCKYYLIPGEEIMRKRRNVV